MNLFDTPQPTPRQMSRRSDPETSRDAAKMMRSTGTAKSHADIVLDHIRRGPGRTAGELANHCPFDSVEVTRRIADLRNAGLIQSCDARKCSVKHRQMQTHWPVLGGAA